MSRFARVAVPLLCVALAGACGTARMPVTLAAGERGDTAQRQVVRTGDLAVTVADPRESLARVERMVAAAGGFVEQSSQSDASRAWLRGRVPARKLESTMEAVAALGREERRSVTAADVTDQHTDLETRLRNGVALRDRLQQLLGRAQDVEDVLRVERELVRIQSEVETLQAQLDRLRSEVALSALDVALERKEILGPVGYVLYGLYWTVSKLFVIR